LDAKLWDISNTFWKLNLGNKHKGGSKFRRWIGLTPTLRLLKPKRLKAPLSDWFKTQGWSQGGSTLRSAMAPYRGEKDYQQVSEKNEQRTTMLVHTN